MSAHYVVAVAAVIMREGKLLAMRRSAQQEAGAGLWETLSGRVEIGEEPLEAIAREIHEECGLTVRIDPRPLDCYQAKRNQDPMVVIVYRADYVAGEVQRSAEHDTHAWLTPEEFAARSTLAKLVAVVQRLA